MLEFLQLCHALETKTVQIYRCFCREQVLHEKTRALMTRLEEEEQQHTGRIQAALARLPALNPRPPGDLNFPRLLVARSDEIYTELSQRNFSHISFEVFLTGFRD